MKRRDSIQDQIEQAERAYNGLDKLRSLATKPSPSSSREVLTETHQELCEAALKLMMLKNADYACESDLFRNFRAFGSLGVLVRLSDKLARLRSFEERNTFSVADESLRDTVQDAINYLIIYYLMKQEAK